MTHYRRIADALDARIRIGAIAEGDRLPSERLLAEEMHVSRMTARKAIQELVAKGTVEPRGGSGHYVRKPKIQQHLTALTSFTEEMAAQGRTGSSRVIDCQTLTPDSEARMALGLPQGAPAHCLVRVRLADLQPVAVETTFLDATRMPDLLSEIDFATASLYRHLRQAYGILPSHAEQRLTARPADRRTAQSLEIRPGDPVLNIQRLTRDADQTAFEFVRSYYRADVFEVRAELNISPRKPE